MNTQTKILVSVQDVALLISIVSQAADLIDKIRAANPDAWADVAADVQGAVAGWRNIPDDVAAIVNAGAASDLGSIDLHPDATSDQFAPPPANLAPAPEVATTYADASVDDVLGTNIADHEGVAPSESLHSGDSGILHV